MTGWTIKQIVTRRYYCPYHGDLTERLSGYTKQTYVSFCPDCGVRLTCILSEGGENTTKKKLKVMHEVKTKHAQETKARSETTEPETEKVSEPKADPLLEKAYQALKDLGGEATSPQLVEKLGFTGESARDQVRRLMDRLHKAHRIHRTKDKEGYHFKVADSEPKPVEVAAA